MMLVIRPPGRRTREPLRTILGLSRAFVFFVSGCAGALVVLSLTWGIGSALHVPARAGLVLLAGAALALAARDAGVLRFKLPQRRGQVKRETMLEHPIGGLVAHGFALGTAFYTFIPVSVAYLVFVAPLVTPPGYGDVAMTAAAFAFGRALPVFVRMFFSKIDADDLAARLMTQGLPLARTISVVCLAVVGGSAGAAAFLRL